MNSRNDNQVEDQVADMPAGTEIRRAKKLRGTLALPGDAHQAVLACGIAALCEEPARIANLPDAPWFHAYRAALESLGVSFEPVPEPVDGPAQWLVRGPARDAAVPVPDAPLAVGHELAAFVLAGMCSGRGLSATLRFDPVGVPEDARRLLAALWPQPGSEDDAASGDFTVGALNPKARGLVAPRERKWDEQSAKVALLFHHLAAGESLELKLRRQGTDLLENLLALFEVGIRVERDDPRLRGGGLDADELTRRIARQMRAAGKEAPVTRVLLPAGARPRPAYLALAGDVTEAAAAALAATLVKGSDVVLENVLLNPGRAGSLAALRRMGADIETSQRRERFGEPQGMLRVRAGELFARRFDGEALADARDEVFLLLAAATFAEGESVFRDLAWLRAGDVDRLREFTAALKRGGVETGEIEDGLVIRGRGESDGGAFDALGHPGLALAWAVIALKSHGTSTLAGADLLEGRYPGLLARLSALGAAPVPSSTATEDGKNA